MVDANAPGQTKPALLLLLHCCAAVGAVTYMAAYNPVVVTPALHAAAVVQIKLPWVLAGAVTAVAVVTVMKLPGPKGMHVPPMVPLAIYVPVPM